MNSCVIPFSEQAEQIAKSLPNPNVHHLANHNRPPPLNDVSAINTHLGGNGQGTRSKPKIFQNSKSVRRFKKTFFTEFPLLSGAL